MKISREEVERVAKLARLKMEPSELEAMTGQMDAILAYVDKLGELDTSNIEPTSHAVPMENAFREDVVRPSLGTEKALGNAPASQNGAFQVPKVIE